MSLSTTTALATFAGSLLLSIVSGAVLGERIEQLGARLGFIEYGDGLKVNHSLLTVILYD